MNNLDFNLKKSCIFANQTKTGIKFKKISDEERN